MDKTPVAAALNSLYRSIRPDLERVETHLREVCRHPNPLIGEISDYLFQIAGKRIRPALLLLCNRLHGRPAIDDAPFWSAMIEIIHTASLIHDDIVDNSDLRRGRATVHAKWGPNVTVLLGDFLYIKSIVLSLRRRNYRLIDILADVTADMIEGELIEVSWNGRVEIPEPVYIHVLDKKTASLFAGACRIGAVLGQAPPEDEARVESFGRNLGLCFQIIDDWLDFTGDAATLGKPVLSDLREGRMTLPVIRCLARMEKNRHREFINLIDNSAASESVFSRILEIVREEGVLEETFDRARSYAAAAKEALIALPSSPARATLIGLTDLLLERTS